MNLIGFSNIPAHLKNFHVFEYIAKHTWNNYEWFWLAPDSVYVKGFKLYELVTHLSVGPDVILSKPMNNPDGSVSHVCDFNVGILLSRSVIEKVMTRYRDCIRDATADSSYHIGVCLYDITGISCTADWNDKTFRTWHLEGPVTDELLTSLTKKDGFNGSISVTPVSTASDIYQLHKHFCFVELDQMKSLTQQIQQEIRNFSRELPEFRSWPYGIPKSMRPKNRFEIQKWDFFTESDIFENSNPDNSQPLTGINREDVDNIVQFITTELPKVYPQRQLDHLLSGYRKFDPTRGMEYIVDVMLTQPSDESSSSVKKRFHLIRPLSRVETVPDPFVTETTEIFVVIQAESSEVADVEDFVNRFTQQCLMAGDTAKLIVAVEMDGDQSHSEMSRILDICGKADAQVVAKRGRTASKDGLKFVNPLAVTVQQSRPVLSLVDAVVAKFGADHLYLVVPHNAEVRPDFLNRVRLHTIRGYQVFSPIPFSKFDPKATKLPTQSASFDVHRSTGHFDRHNFDVAGFYGSDFLSQRSKLASDRLHHYDLINIYFDTDIHLIRAIDPSLILQHRERFCDHNMSEQLYSRCLLSVKEGLASRSQLAQLIFTQQSASPHQ